MPSRGTMSAGSGMRGALRGPKAKLNDISSWKYPTPWYNHQQTNMPAMASTTSVVHPRRRRLRSWGLSLWVKRKAMAARKSVPHRLPHQGFMHQRVAHREDGHPPHGPQVAEAVGAEKAAAQQRRGNQRRKALVPGRNKHHQVLLQPHRPQRQAGHVGHRRRPPLVAAAQPEAKGQKKAQRQRHPTERHPGVLLRQPDEDMNVVRLVGIPEHHELGPEQI